MTHTYILKEGTPEYVGDILSALESQGELNATWQRCFEAYKDEIDRLWKDNAELRDELHALANRVETLTRARLTEPAEVAERMIFVCRLNPGCNVSRPHFHDDDGAVIYVENEAVADALLRQREYAQAIKPGRTS